MIKFMNFMNQWEFMHIWMKFPKNRSYMHEFPFVHKIHKFDHGDDLVIMAMTGCWSCMKISFMAVFMTPSTKLSPASYSSSLASLAQCTLSSCTRKCSSEGYCCSTRTPALHIGSFFSSSNIFGSFSLPPQHIIKNNQRLNQWHSRLSFNIHWVEMRCHIIWRQLTTWHIQ